MNAPLQQPSLPQADTAGFDRLLRFVVVIALIAAVIGIVFVFLVFSLIVSAGRRQTRSASCTSWSTRAVSTT